MRDGKEHGDTLQKFITDVLLRDEKQGSIFSWTEERMNSSLQTYLDFQPSEPANFKRWLRGLQIQIRHPAVNQSAKIAKENTPQSHAGSFIQSSGLNCVRRPNVNGKN